MRVIGPDIPIHRHPTKDESFVILTEASLRAWSLVKKMVWHKLESLEPAVQRFLREYYGFVPQRRPKDVRRKIVGVRTN